MGFAVHTGKMMPDSLYNLTCPPIVGWLLGICLLMAGFLFSLEIKQLLRNQRLDRQRQRMGPRGVAVLVRGLGFRSELSSTSGTGSSAPHSWTVVADTVSEVDRFRSAKRTLKTGRFFPGRKRSTIILGTASLGNLDLLKSAGRG
jgi:hypothetical protein